MARDTDIAWCAGFFDGEGHVSYRRSYPNPKTGHVSPALIVSIPQASANIEVLEFFQSVIGFGNIRGPYSMLSGKPQHVLLYGVNEVEKLFLLLAPYLKNEKTTDFRTALIGYWTHDPTPTSEDLERARKRDKKKGCPKCGDKEWNQIICSKCGYM